MRNLSTALIAAFALGSWSPAHADTAFGAGSLIIPASSPYQTDCGAVSMYGLIYNVLRANAWLQTNGFGTIEIYYAYNPAKLSPNRCTPTNLHHGPQYPAGVAPGPVFPASVNPPSCDGAASPCAAHNDVKWNDGCDFEVFSNTVTPVKLVNKAAILPANDTLIDTVNRSADTTVFPQWLSKRIERTGVVATNVNTVRYWGGSFVIDVLDATNFLKLLDGTIVPLDAAGNTISFAPFKLAGCIYNTTAGGDVAIHRANEAFLAATPKIFTAPPPRLALLTDDVLNRTGTVSDGFLQKYLNNAGLNFAGSQGCPTGGQHAGNIAKCPTGGNPGQIYDRFDFEDVRAGRLSALSGGNPVYKMFWTPHWSLSNPGTGPSGFEVTTMTKISEFADNPGGVMAECASIEAFEGTLFGSNTLNPSLASPLSQFQTCQDNGSGGCTGVAITQGLSINSGGGNDAAGNTACGGGGAGPCTAPRGRQLNCTDPTQASGSACAFFSLPGDAYGQTADYRWFFHVFPSGSSVSDFKPRTGAAVYRPGVAPLISGVSSLDKSKQSSPILARAMIRGDIVSRSFKENNQAKANILYLGDHDQAVSVAGTKVVLQTLLLLGDAPVVPVSREVTRSSPILALINSESLIVQGTFEQITPAPATKTANNDAQVPAFEFPFLLGHVRGIRASQILTTGVAFNALGVPAAAPAPVAFDAAEGIPNVNFAGCSPPYIGSCRGVFTNTATGQGPPNVIVRTGDATIRNAVASGITTTVLQDTVIERILKGSPDPGFPGQYRARLGGIDHSTVAVVDPSLVAGSSRPQMIYVGATDGMMHAICASVGGGCDAVGRELWAFIPRVNLTKLRKNTARIDGSPRVLDLFGDFNPTDGATRRTFKTVLIFQTGSGDPTIVDEMPGVYALDVTDPRSPTVLWEYAVAPGSRAATDLGQGTFVTAGTVRIGGVNKLAAFAQTNNGGTTIQSGSVLSALDVETPGPVGTAVTRLWKAAELYPDPTRSGLTGALAVPAAGVPGGAIAVDKNQTGAITEVVYGNLYGEIWQLDAATGISRYGAGSKPLFRFGQDRKPFGAPPALFADAGTLFVTNVSGGYFDPLSPALWSDPQQHLIAVSLNTLDANTPLTEASGALLKQRLDLAAGEKGFSQVIVVGNQLFFTTDTTNVNDAAFGTGGNTGTLHQSTIGSNTETTTVIAGGAGSIAYNAGTNEAFAGSSDSIKRIAPPGGLPGAGQGTNQIAKKKIERRLWLQTL